MKSYLDLGRRIVEEGEWVYNERTGKRCLTVIRANMEYDVEAGILPMLTTRKSYWKAAVAELLGYIRGYTNAEDFRKLGTKTWDANANLNEAWLANESRRGEDDMGYVYGAVGNNWPILGESKENPGKLCITGSLDQLEKIYNNLKDGIDDRGEIWQMWNPGAFNLGCLRPCMYEHHFSLVNGKLYLDSNQRSADHCLGSAFNQVQVFTLLALMAQITNNKPKTAGHKLVNVHIYEDQLETFKNIQMDRTPYEPTARLIINPKIKTLEDLRTWVTLDDFEVVDYEHQGEIKYPFSV
ncbi:thymidylate synthetase [Halocynthia phage JM-2012]|uniref:thymidylate synthetase n=1 Tax=Halocynthia phage JM-2012 TaxID=1173297 RepID=UPI00025C6933|nr:thymidylate synthetase [Halocynthia phage JM-2012]AFI55378.1 thymidylate synthetase [Halocynthia phage JM-2012]